MSQGIVDGWMQFACARPSPNCNQRPDQTEIDLLVLHNISLPPGDFGGGYISAFFCNELDCSIHPYFEHLRELQVSAHLLVERTGQVTQFVPFHMRAWHAGVSHFQGRDNCNDFSIGIELEGRDDQPYTEAQYECLIQITEMLVDMYPALNRPQIVGHSDIAPERKTDPGPAFDWRRFYASLEQRGIFQ